MKGGVHSPLYFSFQNVRKCAHQLTSLFCNNIIPYTLWKHLNLITHTARLQHTTQYVYNTQPNASSPPPSLAHYMDSIKDMFKTLIIIIIAFNVTFL